MDKRQNKNIVARFTSANKQMAAALAEVVWIHAQERRFSWTLESMERALLKRLNALSAKKRA